MCGVKKIHVFNVDEDGNPVGKGTEVFLNKELEGEIHSYEIQFKLSDECPPENQWLRDLIFGKKDK